VFQPNAQDTEGLIIGPLVTIKLLSARVPCIRGSGVPRGRRSNGLLNGMSARFAHSVGALLDPNKCLFDCSCKPPLSLMQVNLQLRFLVGIGLVNEITLPTTCRWHRRVSLTRGRRQLTLFLQQQSMVSPQVGWVHDLSSVRGNFA
jgi:hypothetical protein